MNYLPTQKALIESALKRLNLWPIQLKELPQPLSVETGVAGESRVYLLRLPAGKNDQSLGLVAKFESNPDRATKEWATISELRAEYRQYQHGLLLPIDGNVQTDGVILFLLAGQDHPGMECTALLKVVQKQLTDALPNCRATLEQTVGCLHHFHWNATWRGSAADSLPRTWRDVFNVDPLNLQKSLDALRNTGVVEDTKLGTMRIRGRTLIDPTIIANKFEDKLLGWCKRGRIHGDLNLTNILCLLDDARKCWAAYIIDFSHSKAEMPIALDYAKVEVELWQHLLYDLDAEGDLPILTLNILSYLEGRMPLFPRETNVGVMNFLEVLCWWRTKTFEILSSGASARYMMTDYFICLFFLATRALQWPDVQKTHRKTLVLSLLAAQTAQTLHDVDSGKYSLGQVNTFPIPPNAIKLDQSVWLEGPRAAPSVSTIASRSDTDPYNWNLFIPRREVERALPNLEKTIPILVLGCRGSGKSWAISHIARTLSQPVAGRRIIDLDIRLFPRRANSTHRDLCQWLIGELCQRLAIPNTIDCAGGWQGADETTSSIAIRELASRFTGTELYLLLDNADSIVLTSFAETAGHFYRQMAGWKHQFEIIGKNLCLALASAKDPEHIESIIGLSIFHGAHRCLLRDFSQDQISESAKSCGIQLSNRDVRTVLRLTGGRPAHVAGVIGDILAGDLALRSTLTPHAVPFFNNTLRPQFLTALREVTAQHTLREIQAGRIVGLGFTTIHELEVEGLVRCNGPLLELSSEFVRAMIGP
jgi:hypothetical protein